MESLRVLPCELKERHSGIRHKGAEKKQKGGRWKVKRRIGKDD
jgi:hypothetical protein